MNKENVKICYDGEAVIIAESEYDLQRMHVFYLAATQYNIKILI